MGLKHQLANYLRRVAFQVHGILHAIERADCVDIGGSCLPSQASVGCTKCERRDCVDLLSRVR